MKYIIIILALVFLHLFTTAQSVDTKHADKKKTSQVKHKKVDKEPKASKNQIPAGTAIRGGKLVPLHNGSHDYTPGSPIGTGGAGGNTMSGSPQGSASENAIGKKPSNELRKKNNARNANKMNSYKATSDSSQ